MWCPKIMPNKLKPNGGCNKPTKLLSYFKSENLLSFHIYEAPFYCLFSISWYQEFDFLISRNNTHFLISKHRIPDIKKSMFWYQEMCIISRYQEIEFLISRIQMISWYQGFLDIKKYNSWYKEFDFLYQEIWTNSWYQEIEFLISRNQILDIKKLISWYQKIFLNIKNSFLAIKKCWINSKTAPHTYQHNQSRL